jgi:hypothetical protein
MLSKIWRGLIILVVVCASSTCWSHPMPSSVVNLSVFDNFIRGDAKIPLVELETATGKLFQSNEDFYKKYFLQHIKAVSNNASWTTEVKGFEVITDHDPFIGNYSEVKVSFKLIPPNRSKLRNFKLEYDAVIHQVVTHEAIIFIQSDWNNGIQDQSKAYPIGVVKLDVPSGTIMPLRVNLNEGSWWKGFRGMFLFGMQHIRAGLDHILFLLTLLLIAPLTMHNKEWTGFQGLGYTVSRFLKISLAFTMGHSVTLLIGSFNLIHFRVQYIEVLIAISILISAVNCVRPIFLKKEIVIAAGFGLIHGLAFSISLSDVELGTASKLISILGFNLGIEAMQLIIMLLFFPILLLSKYPFYRWVRIVFSVFTTIAASAWIAERISNEGNLVSSYVNSLL